MAKELPSPAELEKQLLDRQNNVDYNPLDSQATMFHLYLPRFQGQLNFMSKKEMQTLMFDLAASEYNPEVDVNKLLRLSKAMGTNALKRTIAAVIENPLQDENVKLLSKEETKLFTLFDGLLTNKYFTCIARGLEEKAKNNEFVQEIETIIIHKVDTQSARFKSRKACEKDAFATGNKLLAAKFLMIMVTHDEVLNKMEQEKLTKENENG